jgi:formate dehydrogenase subunit delta
MKIDALVKMANEISAFFEGEAGEAEAPRMIANHLRRYWEPRMRQQIVAHYQQRGGEGLDELALKGVAVLATESAPAAPAQGAR